MNAKQWLLNLLRKRKKQQPEPRPDTPVHPMCRCSIEWKAMEDERVAYRCKTHESKECDGCGECQEHRTMKKYRVTITLEPLEFNAVSIEEAKAQALGLYNQDYITRRAFGLLVDEIEAEELDEEEE